MIKDKMGFIQYIVIIAVILAVVFLSQQPFTRPAAQKMVTMIGSSAGFFADNGKEWFTATIYPRVAKEAQKRGAEAVQEVEKQKDITAQNVWEKIKKYFAEKFSGISGTEVE